MPCGPVTGQCLEPHPTIPGEDVPVCCDPFAELFGFSEVSTAGRHNGCFVGIRNQGEAIDGEVRDGRWCGWGCAGSEGDRFPCDDHHMLKMADPRDGKRWLRPHPNRPSVDARGVLHDLRSNQPHLVSRETHFQRGACWYNDGRECFGPDVCSCFRKTIRVPPDEHEPCPGGEMPGEPLTGILEDEVYRGGFGWPPDPVRQGSASNSQGDGWYCRRFNDTRRGSDRVTSVVLAAESFGGIPNVIEPMLAPIFASTTTCNGNALNHCFGQIEQPADPQCGTALWETRRGFYSESVARDRFDALVVRLNDTSIGTCDAVDEVVEASASFKSRVLRFVREHDFPDDPFARLDHLAVQHGNSGLGRFRKRWDGNVEVPGVFGRCRLHQTGCQVDVVCRLQRVEMTCILVLPPSRSTILTRDIFRIATEPHVRFQIVAVCAFEASLPEPCFLLNTWRPLNDPLRIRPLVLDGLRVRDDLDSIEFVDGSDRPFVPTEVTEWRGFLGDHSDPPAYQLRTNFASCEELADAFRAFDVHGWPVALDSRPDDPVHSYAGKVTLGFR